MKSTDAATYLPIAIASGAASGYVTAIPATQAEAGSGRASQALGYPPETMISTEAGGVRPFGSDENGLFNLISSGVKSVQANGVMPWSKDFSAGVGGYPSGAIVADPNTPGVLWVSTADNNTLAPSAAATTWKNVLSGYATQSWVAGNYVSSSFIGAGTGNAVISNVQAVNWTQGSTSGYVQVTANGVSMAVPTGASVAATYATITSLNSLSDSLQATNQTITNNTNNLNAAIGATNQTVANLNESINQMAESKVGTSTQTSGSGNLKVATIFWSSANKCFAGTYYDENGNEQTALFALK